jgi:hypothetical protein
LRPRVSASRGRAAKMKLTPNKSRANASKLYGAR